MPERALINWIDVKDRVPPHVLSVLVSWRHIISGGVMVREGSYDADWSYWSLTRDTGWEQKYAAEFWAFMPEPPDGPLA